ncbi:MAG: BolA family protein [Simkaniaceae bacterium]
MDLQDEVKETILAALPGAKVSISDPMCDNAHFEAVVVAEQFEGLTLIKQHQIVMQTLKDKFDTSLHALALKTMTPKEYENA